MSSFSVLLASKIDDNFPMSSWRLKVALDGLPRGLLVPPASLPGPSNIENVCSRLHESAYFAKSTFAR